MLELSLAYKKELGKVLGLGLELSFCLDQLPIARENKLGLVLRMKVNKIQKGASFKIHFKECQKCLHT